MGAQGGYAVIDFETTGLYARTDRVVEVGVICLDPHGEVVDEWSTLVNPQRDVSAGGIHGITARDVYFAPQFYDVAGLLADCLRDRVVVAHNLAFEAQFLTGEFGRLDFPLQISGGAGICTMNLACTYLPRSPRNLAACCACCGIDMGDHHAALDDARAAAGLLCSYIAFDDRFAERWSERLVESMAIEWPVMDADRSKLVPRDASANSSSASFSYLGRLAANLPAHGGEGPVDSYLDLLDRALIDRILSLHETDELVALSMGLGLSLEQVRVVHDDYMTALARQAWADGVITSDEQADLVAVGELLGIDDARVLALIEGPTDFVTSDGPGRAAAIVGGFALESGDKVVFTGENEGVSRGQLISQAEGLGLQVTNSVSRLTKVVVASDPDSISGKARRARESGVPVVGYEAYLRLLGSLDVK